MDSDPKESTDPFNLKSLDDPDVEARERARLMPVDSVPSRELQDAFADFAESYTKKIVIPGEHRIVARNLFLAMSYRATQLDPVLLMYEREYYKQPRALPFEVGDIYKSADIRIPEGGLIEYVSVAFMGEHPSQNESEDARESLEASFSYQVKKGDGSKAFKNTRFDQHVQGRYLGFYYDDDSLIGINFDGAQRDKGLKIWKSASGGQIQLDDLLNRGTVQVARDGGIYKVTYDVENKSIVIERSQGDELKDKITIPTDIASQEIFNNLFPNDLIKDPYNAGCELDYAWKATSPQSFGTTWKRLS